MLHDHGFYQADCTLKSKTKGGDSMNNTLYVGIDVSSKSNIIYLMLPNGDKHSNCSVANSHEGSTQLVKRIHSALTSHSLDTVLNGY